MKKIAFCFLIYEKINHEELWHKFFQNIDKNKYAIYIHYKYNKPLKYFEDCKLEYNILTKWGHVSFVHAYNLLLKKAYEDGCDKFISLTNSCIPLKSFDHVYNFLTENDFAYFNMTPQEQCFPRCNSLLRFYDRSDIQKSSFLFILNRKLCALILSYSQTQIDEEYGNIDAPDEHFYIIAIYKHRLTDEIITTPNLADGATTFTNWEGMNYKYQSFPYGSPKTYTHISSEELGYLMDSKSLFGRKFDDNCQGLYDNAKYMQHIVS